MVCARTQTISRVERATFKTRKSPGVEIMLNRFSPSWLLAGWLAAVTALAASTFIMGARISTSLLFVALGLAPVIVTLMIGFDPPSPTIAEILYAVDAKDRRP